MSALGPHLLSLSIYWNAQGGMGYQEIYSKRKELRTRPNQEVLHELPYTEMLKFGTIRLTADSPIFPS